MWAVNLKAGSRGVQRALYPILGLVCFAFLGGCSIFSPSEPPLADDNTAVIPGQDTSDQAPIDARRTVLTEAAQLTVDHGFQYFRIVPTSPDGGPARTATIQPGVDTTIKVYSADDVKPGAPGVWDAQNIIDNGVPDVATAQTGEESESAPTVSSTPMEPAPMEPAPMQPAPTAPASGLHCTAYGCDW